MFSRKSRKKKYIFQPINRNNINKLTSELEIAKAKRAKIVTLLQELNKLLQNTRNVTDSTHELKLCIKVQKKAAKLENISKKLRIEVMKRRILVIKLLTKLIRERSRIKLMKPTESMPVSIPRSKAKPATTTAKPFIKPNYNVNYTTYILDSEQIHGSKNDCCPRIRSTERVEDKTRVAGNINKDRCERCEVLDGEEVCGANGQTYTTLCHAINCAGLAMKDVTAGSCILKVCLAK